MELIGVLLMLVAGGSLAGAVWLVSRAAARSEPERDAPIGDLDTIAASILVQVLVSGGTGAAAAIARVAELGYRARITPDVDVCSWAETFARYAGDSQRRELLARAVAIVSGAGRTVPLRQYAALLDLDFGLGFHADALARLRLEYPFEYVDYAKDARPPEADRGGTTSGKPPHSGRSRRDLLALFALDEQATRRQLTAAYRKLVARTHPDRFHAGAPEEEREAARRFLEITAAYQELLQNFEESFPRG